MQPKNIPHLLISSIIIIAFLLPLPASAQGAFQISVEYLDNSKFPQVQAYVSVSDQNGLPIKNLEVDAFTLIESGVPVTIQDFKPIQNIEQPLSIALIMDTSTSMGSQYQPTPMQKSVEAAKSFVDQLQPQDRVAVIKFSDKPEEILSLTEDKTLVKQALDSLQPEENKTALYDGIVAGIKTLESQSGRRIIVVVTDGKDTGTGLFNFEMAMREASAASIPIYPMGFGGAINVKEMKQMAELTGGVAQILPKVLDLQNSFAEVLNILREQYLIRYVSILPADDKDYELLLTVNYGGGQEQTTYHFIAKSSPIQFGLPNFQPDQVIGGLVKFTPVTDWPAPLKSLEILADGTQIGKVESAPFEYEWNSFNSGIVPGIHDFLFKMVDVAGNAGQLSVSLNVQPPITIEITTPTDNSTVSGSINFTAKVTALPGVSLSRVVFFVDEKEIASIPADPNLTQYETTWDTGNYPAQAHPISVIAYDTAGLFTTEKKMLVNVQVGGYSGMIVLIVLAIAALVIPIAMRSRRRAGRSANMVVSSGVASAGGQPLLRELDGVSPNQVWPLGMSEVRLGRKRDENDIALKGLKASRRQASIRFEQGLYAIYSLSANNPVLVNDKPVVQMQVLKPGDLIRLGETVLRFES
jgi:VWFA-related protein